MKIIGQKYGTGKITKHKYEEIYPMYIEKYYKTKGGMLEIGLAEGASLNMWMELFPNMHIYGLDKDLIDKETCDRHTIIQADQGSEESLVNALSQINHPLYFINDDGSHIPEHQALTFNLLFPKLEIGGVYIIEDIETSYWTKGGLYGYQTRYGKGHPKSIIEIFKHTVDGVNYKFSKSYAPEIHHQEYFHSVTFARNCIIIIKKSPDIDTKYRYEKYL